LDLRKKTNFFLKSEFAIALSTTSIATGIQLLAVIIINKILAMTIGPSGIALMGQFTNFKDLVTNFANGSLGQGVTKYIADPKFENKKILATSNLFTTIVSILTGILVVIFSNSLSNFLFRTIEYSYVFTIFGFSVPFFAFNNLLISTVNGFRNYKLLAKLKIINSLIVLCISGSLVWYFLLDGALIAQAINTSIIFLASLLIIYKTRSNYFSFNIEMFDKKVFKKLLAFILMAITSMMLKPIVQIYLRDYIISSSGEFEAGIWEAVRKLSIYYTQIITVALGVYYLPKLSSLNTNLELKKEIFHGIRKVIPLIIFLGFFIFWLKKWIILLLFSEDFSMMNGLIFPQLIGDFFMILSFMIAYLMLAKAMVKLFVISQIVFSTLQIIFSVSFFNIAGIEGMIWANTLNYFLYLIFVTIVFRKILFIKSN
jgi:polysaccharide transporter, PST family